MGNRHGYTYANPTVTDIASPAVMDKIVEAIDVCKQLALEVAEKKAQAREVLKKVDIRPLIQSCRAVDQWVFHEHDKESVIGSINQAGWLRVLEVINIKKVMSQNTAEELDTWIKDWKKLPVLTTENVMQVVEQIAEKLGSYLEEACFEVYRSLTPGASYTGYKTNKKYLTEKVILEGWVRKAWSGKGFRVDEYYSDALRNIDNLFHFLDNQPFPKEHFGQLYTGIERSDAGSGKTTYFSFKCYKKGTLHINFLRADLLKKLNEIAGKRLESDVDYE